MPVNLQNTALEISAGRPDQFPKKRICHIVFSGRSNVGKSSLINTLLGRKKLARVSSSPGKTITVNFYNVDGKMYFVDLPGYGFAKRPPDEKKKWSLLVESYFASMTERNDDMLVVQLIDAKVGITSDDSMMLDWMNGNGVNYVVAATKCDKLNKTAFTAGISSILGDPSVEEGTDVVPFSSLNGDGKNELLNIIFDFSEL
ncbi:MAG: YihA family ribosome biogenesis GTP-binding protein [Clostridia bacterium]|nr:YihA family ribosome biogenesis GTP-binding protein [Clostridia bacterium]